MELRTNEGSHVWLVPNQQKYGNMNAVMLGMSNVITFPSKNDSLDKTHDTSNIPPMDSNIKMMYLKKSSWIYGRFQRKLVNETLGTFLYLQKSSSGSASDADFRAVLLKKSKEYRSIIQVCISEMNQYLESFGSGRPIPFKEDPETLKVDCQLLYKMELVLGLVEIVFIDTQPGGTILNPIMNWIRIHFPQCRQRMSESLSLEQPANYELYWDTCFGLILQGLLDEARDLLSHHPDSNTDSFLSMDEILRKMPVYFAYSGVSEAEFSIRWQHWQSECSSRLEKGDFLHCRQLQVICKLLCGDLETMLSLLDILDTWYHLMGSFLFYTNPTAKLHRLASAATEALSAFGLTTNVTHLDELLLAVLQINNLLVLKECQSVLNNLWFSSHLADLFYHAFDHKTGKNYMKDIRESLLVDYGSELVSHPSLWQVGLLYLDTSGPSFAGPCVQSVLERVPLTSDAKAFKVIQEATKRGMDSVAMGVCRVMGRRKFREGQLGSAIWWGIRSQDSAFTSHLAHMVLHKYMEDGEFMSSSLLDHLGPSMQLSDALTFLSKYREFHLMYQNGEIKDAASLLVSLIASKLAPEYFWPVLLEDALPLLQSPDPVISSEQTYKLMYCLQNICISHGDSEKVCRQKQKLYSSFLDKEKNVRLALTHNLARAVIQEGTVEL